MQFSPLKFVTCVALILESFCLYKSILLRYEIAYKRKTLKINMYRCSPTMAKATHVATFRVNLYITLQIYTIMSSTFGR